jgi:uncharacterized protein
MAQTVIKPLSTSDRILFLDVLRGLAIFFIFVANTPMFLGSAFYQDALKESFSTFNLDYWVDMFVLVFVGGKFYSIFALLFGIGLVVQQRSAARNGINFKPFFARRLSGLLLIGLIHLFFLWLGDILALYAVIGFILLWMVDFSDRKLLIWATVLLFMPLVHIAILGFTGFFYPIWFFETFDIYAQSYGIPMSDWMGNGQETTDPLTMLAVTDFGLFIKLNLISPLIRVGDLLFDGRIFKVLAMFLIGIWAGRHIFEKDLLNNVPFLKKIAIWGFVIGVPANIMRAVIQEGDFGDATGTLLGFLMYAIGVAPLACAYAASIALWVKAKPRHLMWFAPVGKTALSNYLFQTVISIIIYYGVGFGLSGTFGSSVGTAIAVVIFIFQIWMSKLWLSKYQYGPIEWVWRKMTYGESLTVMSKH